MLSSGDPCFFFEQSSCEGDSQVPTDPKLALLQDLRIHIYNGEAFM